MVGGAFDGTGPSAFAVYDLIASRAKISTSCASNLRLGREHMDSKRLRDLANQNQDKAREEARMKRELESQRHLAELRRQEEQKDRERKKIEARKVDIQRKVEEAASRVSTSWLLTVPKSSGSIG